MFGNGGLAMMKMVVMMMMTIWTDRSPICALFPGVLRGLLTDYQWEGVDPRHPNTSNNSSTTFTLSTSTPPPLIFKKTENVSKLRMKNYAEYNNMINIFAVHIHIQNLTITFFWVFL